eukprot:maker-scaffold91_size383040-snap-gene-1.23 protein:Tk03185 transcript:maker-scaffold91_size383040-snap-gene-1.23-mRNA-1 annotation:"sarcosine oxidase"
MHQVFDIAIIGAGLIGSSVAKYLANLGSRAILLGPSESNPRPGSHGAWHDEGRISKIFDMAPIWRTLDVVGIYQPQLAGYIQPRKLVEAQQKLASLSGCQILDGHVAQVEQTGDLFKLRTNCLKEILAQKVVITAGSYSPFLELNLLDRIDLSKIDLTLKTQTVAYLKVEDQITHAESAQIPTMINNFPSQHLDLTYIQPPMRFPDDQYYLKIGHGTIHEKILATKSELDQWYELGSGDSLAVEHLEAYARQFFPAWHFTSVSGRGCVTAHTKSGRAPYIDEIAPNVWIGIGGCGHAAKSCDEIGRILAHLALGREWCSEIAQPEMSACWL